MPLSVAIIESKKTKSDLPKSPIDAHLRNAYVLRDELSATILYNRNHLRENWDKHFDNVVVSYGTFYADIVPFLRWMEDRKNKSKFYFMSNEYNLIPNSSFYKFLKNNNYSVIANHIEKGTSVKEYDNFHTFNLNLLLFDGRNAQCKKQYDLIYWGSYRPNREVYFKKYFNRDMMLSTSQKNLRKFRAIGCDAIGINKLNWDKHKETLNLFKYTLYIEDVKTHNHYSHLANRFYEALQCNVLMFFDINTKKTTELAGLTVPDFYFVKDAKELKDKMKVADKDYQKRLDQQAEWVDVALSERRILMNQLKELFDA